MSMAFSAQLSRSGAIVQGLQLLEALTGRASLGDQQAVAREVFASWEARLNQELALNATYPLPVAVGAALAELRASLDDIPQDSIVEWIDMVGQNVLVMSTVQAVAFQTSIAVASVWAEAASSPTADADWIGALLSDSLFEWDSAETGGAAHVRAEATTCQKCSQSTLAAAA